MHVWELWKYNNFQTVRDAQKYKKCLKYSSRKI